MSSPLLAAMCVARADKRVDVEISPGSEYAFFPCSTFFALLLLHEASSRPMFHANGMLWRHERDALQDAVAYEELCTLIDVPASDSRKITLAERFIVSATYVATRNWYPQLWTRDASGIFFDPHIPGTDPRSIAADERLQHLATAIWDATEGDLARMDAELPAATIRIAVTDEEWCVGLEPGMGWDVYAQDLSAPLLL